jgi:hypothetical protein
MKWLKNLFGQHKRHKFTEEDRSLALVNRRQMKLINMQLKEKEDELMHRIQLNKIRRAEEQLKAFDDEEEDYEEEEEDDTEEVKEPSMAEVLMQGVTLLKTMSNKGQQSQPIQQIKQIDVSDEQINEYIKQYSKKELKEFQKLDVDKQKHNLKQLLPNELCTDSNINKIINVIDKI